MDEYIAGVNARHGADTSNDGVFTDCCRSPCSMWSAEQSDGRIRHGLIGMVDLDAYDFTPGSGALIRATEGTVLDRIPPRAARAPQRPHRAAPRDAADRRPRQAPSSSR